MKMFDWIFKILKEPFEIIENNKMIGFKIPKEAIERCQKISVEIFKKAYIIQEEKDKSGDAFIYMNPKSFYENKDFLKLIDNLSDDLQSRDDTHRLKFKYLP